MKQTLYAILFTIALVLSGCGTNDSIDPVNNNTDDSNSNTTHFIKLVSPIDITSDSEIKTINAYVVDADGVGKSGVNVSITAISDIRFGAIISASRVITDDSGRASFTYQAPQSLQTVDGNTTSLTLTLDDNGIKDSETIELHFQKAATSTEIVKPIVVLNTGSIDLTSNSQTVGIRIKVFEEDTTAPYTKGTVKVKLPSKVKDGVDVGYFNEYEVAVGDNGIAEFIYTGPQNLKELIDNGDLNSTFEFYHTDNVTQYTSLLVNYVPSNDYVPANYILTSVSDDDKYTMGLEKTKSFTIYLKDDKGNLIDDSKIQQITIKAENISVGKLVDPDNTDKVQELTYNGDDAINKKPFTIVTSTISGLLPVDINVSFTDANEDNQTLEIKMNVTVFSGPPTALSISYVGVEHDATIGKFIEKFAVSAVDAYDNPINTHPYISTGAMVEYAVDGSSSTDQRGANVPRLWHGKLDTKATINAIGDNKAQLEATSDVFKYVDFDNDKLVIFGAGYVYESLGKWDIQPNSDSILDLVDDYYGITRDDLYYAVGHNNRQDLCSNDGREYVGKMISDTYQLDENGNVLIEFAYDYHLTGKDIMVWVNLTGYQADTKEMTRIGEAQKHTLRGMGFIAPESYKISSGAENVKCYFHIEHENVPEMYLNGHFGFAYTGCHVDSIINSSNNYDARDCNNSSVAYVELNVSNPTSKECTIQLTSIRVAPEFQSSVLY